METVNPSQKSSKERSSSTYGEFSPRISIGKTTGLVDGKGLIKDIYFSNTFEQGNSSAGQSRSNLHGIGFNLNLPYFLMFQWNFYVRDNLDKEGTTTQSTFAYKLPFSFGEKYKFMYGAYIDIVHGD